MHLVNATWGLMEFNCQDNSYFSEYDNFSSWGWNLGTKEKSRKGWGFIRKNKVKDSSANGACVCIKYYWLWVFFQYSISDLFLTLFYSGSKLDWCWQPWYRCKSFHRSGSANTSFSLQSSGKLTTFKCSIFFFLFLFSLKIWKGTRKDDPFLFYSLISCSTVTWCRTF